MARAPRIAWVLVSLGCSNTAPVASPAADDLGVDFDAGSAAAVDVVGAPLDAGFATVSPPSDGPDAAVSDLPLPLTAPPDQWTWVGFSAAHCADGSSTGIGVNLTPGARDVMIFLQGGGACWDGTTCWGPVSTSFYVATGYGPAEFATDVLRGAMLPMRRGDPTNPFNNLNLVYVPYCTGDVHAGDAVVQYTYNGVRYTTWHVGYRNLGVYLPRLVATFASARRVILAGDSAGGFGAALNMDRVQQAFVHARVDVLDDSGPAIRPDPARWTQWLASWHVPFPPDCGGCATDVTAAADYLRRKYPTNRFGLISYTHDTVITTFMNVSPTVFSNELQALGDMMDSDWAYGRYYFIPGVLHVGLVAPGPGLHVWLQAFADDDPGWTSFRIPGL